MRFLLCCRVALSLFLAVSGQTSIAKAAGEPVQELWLYCPVNLLVKDNIEQLENILRRAAGAGYTHINITDSKFCRLDQMFEPYFQHVERVKKLCGELKLTIVPSVFPLGWSNDILANDPNLAEGLPVKDALFVVKNGEARLVADPPASLPLGDMSDLKKWNYHDDVVKSDDGAALIRDCPGTNARLVKTVQVSPFRQYHISLRSKTKDFTGTPEVKVLVGEQALSYNDLGVQPTQDWTTHHVIFNSLDNREVNLYVGCWGGGNGSWWIDDVTLDEVGLVNLIRRPGAPLTIRRDDRSLEAQPEEGKNVEPIVDPKMGNISYPGDYNVWHEPPVIRTKLPDGTRMRVSYYHPMLIYGGAVMISLAEPKSLDLLRHQAETVHKLWGAKDYFMGHDEIRLLNWDKASQDRGLSPGKLLAENVRACTAALRKINPGGRIFVWSDMFDPHHNAVDKYYLVNGSLKGSWEGLDKDVIIVNWNDGKSSESLRWFADRGHKQLIAGYYDAPVEGIRRWQDAAKGVPSMMGIMYTTWRNDYSQMEAFAKLAKGSE